MNTIKPSTKVVPAVETAEACLDHQRATLQELAEIGMKMARALQAQAHAAGMQAGTAARRELDLSLARVTREVRLTRALEARLVRQAAKIRRLAERTRPVQGHDAQAVPRDLGPYTLH